MMEVAVGDTIVEFPDGTSREVMKAALQKRFPAGAVQERSGSFAPPANADALQAGLQQKAAQLTRGPETVPGQKIALDFLNQGSAASQGTTPNINAQQKNLISNQVFESDAGEVMYRDPATGQVVPTDKNKHVVLRDPNDNTPKVYARTADTDEGRLSAAGRILLAGGGSGAPTARAAIPTPNVVRPGQEVVNAAERIGVEVPRAVSTDSMATQRAAAVTRNIPFAGDPIIKSAERTITQLGNRADDVASGYGAGVAQSAQGAGDAARTSINRYVTGTTAERATKLYNKVDDLVDHSVSQPLNATQSVMNTINLRREQSALPMSQAAEKLSAGVNREGGLTYEGTKGLRTYVGELLDNPSILPSDISGSELKLLYGALTDDLKNTINVAGGPQARAAFERANKYYELASNRRAELAKIVGTDGNAPAELVFDRLVGKAGSSSRADIEALAKARKAIGSEDWGQFVSGVVAKLGRDPAGRTGPEALNATDFSPQRFLTAYGKLSPAGKALLFRIDDKTNLARNLDDIATVSTRFKELQKFANPSGTAQNLAGAGLGAGFFAEPLTAIGTVIGGRVLGEVLSRPAAAASIADWSRNYERLARTPTAPRLALLEVSSRNLANTLKDSGVLVSPTDFIKMLQGPVKAPAAEEQP